MFLGSQFTITRHRIPKIGTHAVFINFYVESKFQLSRFNRLLVISKSILICQNSRTKTNVEGGVSWSGGQVGHRSFVEN